MIFFVNVKIRTNKVIAEWLPWAREHRLSKDNKLSS